MSSGGAGQQVRTVRVCCLTQVDDLTACFTNILPRRLSIGCSVAVNATLKN